MRRGALLFSWSPCLLAVVTLTASANAVELREAPNSPVFLTIPDGWALSTDGAWNLADAPDHAAKVRIASHGSGLLADVQAEAYMMNFIAQSWGTYTVDRHVRRVACGRFAGLELYGHGAGDSWDRAKFHMYLLIDTASPTKGAMVLVSGKEETWDTYHPSLDKAVHALHGG